MSLLAPINELLRGANAFLRGVRWLMHHPRHFMLLFVPMMLGLLLLGSTWGLLWSYSDAVFAAMLFAKPTVWWGIALYTLTKAVLYFFFFAVGLLVFLLGVNVLSSPIYDRVSFALECELIPGRAQDISIWGSIILIKEEIKKSALVALVSIAVLLVPGLNFLSPFVTAFFIGWAMYDFPLARRGWTFRQRLGFVGKRLWVVMGLGLWLLLPGLQMILMPLAVVGGTMLAIEDLEHHSTARGDST